MRAENGMARGFGPARGFGGGRSLRPGLIAAPGMKTSLRRLGDVDPRAIIRVCPLTLVPAGPALAGIHLFPS